MGIKRIKFFLALALCIFLCGCAAKNEPKAYVLMEKQLADIKGRQRTTAKIVIANKAGSDPDKGQTVQGSDPIEKALRDALEDLRKDDPELDAALVWAYKNRSELNDTFTLGKLEWSKDKKGWEGKQNLSQETIVEIR